MGVVESAGDNTAVDHEVVDVAVVHKPPHRREGFPGAGTSMMFQSRPAASWVVRRKSMISRETL